MIALHKGSETNSFDIAVADYSFQLTSPEECKPRDIWDGLMDTDVSGIDWNFSSCDEDEKLGVVIYSMIFHSDASVRISTVWSLGILIYSENTQAPLYAVLLHKYGARGRRGNRGTRGNE